MSERGWLDKANWYFRKWRYGLKGVRRRVSAIDLFGSENVAYKANLSKVIFLQKVNDSKTEVIRFSHIDLAKMCANIICTEIDLFVKYVYFIGSTLKRNDILPDVDFVFR